MACYILSFDGVAEKIRIPSSTDVFDIKTFTRDLQEAIKKESYVLKQLPEVSYDGQVIINPSTNENINLSSLALRPFIIPEYKGIVFKSIEHYYWYRKALTTGDINAQQNILSSETGAEARAYGEQIKASSAWNKIKESVLIQGIKESFLQNPNDLVLLLNTSDLKFVSKEKSREWKLEYPKLLISIRDELAKQYKFNFSKLDPDQVNLYLGGSEGVGGVANSILKRAGYTKLNNFSPKEWTDTEFQTDEIKNSFEIISEKLNRNISNMQLADKRAAKRYIYQVNQSDSVFAFANFNSKTINGIDTLVANGSTAYAVEQGIIKNIPVYIYNFKDNKWYKWNSTDNTFDEYIGTPNLTINAAIVGTSYLSTNDYNTVSSVIQDLVNSASKAKLGLEKFEEQTIIDPLVIISSTQTETEAKRINGIDTLRHPIMVSDNSEDIGMHYGNPFSHRAYQGVQIVFPTVKESVVAYEQWLRGVAYQEIEPERRQWILNQINSGKLNNKQLVYYTNKVPDKSYGKEYYDFYQAPNHAHILQKLILEHQNGYNLLNDMILKFGYDKVSGTIKEINKDNSGLSKSETRKLSELLGEDVTLKILRASEEADPALHVSAIKKMVKDELKKDPAERNFHVLYLVTKHDGLPLKELADLPIPKFFHFSISSLGGTDYEPNILKYNDFLDRIEYLIKSKTIDPELCTIRIEPIIPGVTNIDNIIEIIQRASSMGIKNFRTGIFNPNSKNSSNETITSEQDESIIKVMDNTNYNWKDYYNNIKGSYKIKSDVSYAIWATLIPLAQSLGINLNSAGEIPKEFKDKVGKVGHINAAILNAALGVSDIVDPKKLPEDGISCYGDVIDLLAYNDQCKTSYIRNYVIKGTKTEQTYYDIDGKLNVDLFTQVVKVNPNITNFNSEKSDYTDNLIFTIPDGSSITLKEFKDQLNKLIKADNKKAITFNKLYTILDAIKDIIIEDEDSSFDNVFWKLLNDDYVGFAEDFLSVNEIEGLQTFFKFNTNLEEDFIINESQYSETIKEERFQPSSDILERINHYLDVSLALKTDMRPLQEIDKREALQIIITRLNTLGVQAHLIESDVEMEKLGFPSNTEAVVSNGEIYINFSRSSLSSPIHELMHLVFAIAKKDYQVFANFMHDLQTMHIPEFDIILEQVQSSEYYSKLIESDQLEEAFVRYLSGIIDGKITNHELFDEFYNSHQEIISDMLNKTFGVSIVDPIEFLRTPFNKITQYDSELFKERTLKNSGYSARKYNVDISGKIMQFIHDHMGNEIQEGECK